MNFDQNDISTYGLTFGITTVQNLKRYFTSIVIEENKRSEAVQGFVIRPTYNVLYASNFNSNTRKYNVYAQDVDQMDLHGLLLELTKTYFQNLGVQKEDQNSNGTIKKEILEIEVYQCQDCLTIYDPSIGDVTKNIPGGTYFSDLPDEYCCSLCEAPKSNFLKNTLEIF